MSGCIDPDAITEAERQSFAAEPASVAMTARAHIAACPSCHEEVDWLRDLRALFDRPDDPVWAEMVAQASFPPLAAPPTEHPTSDTLRDYLFDLLPLAAAAPVAAHLAGDCARCGVIVAELAPLAPRTTVTIWDAPFVRGLRRVVAELLAPPNELAVPALRMMGDGHDGAPQLYTVEDVQISIDLVAEEAGLMLYCIIAAAESPLLARLVNGTSKTASGVVEAAVEDGLCQLGPIEPGAYAVELLFPDRLLTITTLTIEPRRLME